MIPVSDLLKESVKYSRSISVRVDIMQGSTVVLPDVPVVAGSLTRDRGQKIRMTSDITLDIANHPEITVNQETHRFRVTTILTSLGVHEEVQHGIFRIDDISIQQDDILELSGSGLESYIIDARFLSPRTPPYGVSTVQHITTLIQEVLPTQVVSVECTRDKPVQATAPWERERWDAIDALATSIGAEVYADPRGFFVIRDAPSLSGGYPAYTINRGPGGTLSEVKVKSTRDRVYNAVVATGQSSDPNVPPVWGWAYDNNPASPTYFYGDYGQVPKFFSSQFLATVDQCTAAAQSQLDSALAANRALSLTSLSLTFLEPGDVIDVEVSPGVLERRLVQKIVNGLGTDRASQIETLLMKDTVA
jgi:translation initiation factor IF-1